MDKFIALLLNPVFDIGFMAQIYIPTIIMLFSQKRRERFILRVILFSLLFFASTYLIPFRPFEQMHVNYVWTVVWTVLGYSIHFIVLVFCMYGAFKINFKECLFICVMAYNIQHATFALSRIFEISFEAYRKMPFVYMAVQWIPNIGVSLLFTYRIKEFEGFRLRSETVLYVALLALLVDIIISDIADVPTEPNVFVYCFYSATIVGCVVLLIMQFNNLRQNKLLSVLNHTKKMWEEDRKLYEMTKEHVQTFAMKVHDIKHFVASLTGSIDQKELEKIDDILSGVGQTYLYTTGSLPLDVIINLKSNACANKKISFNFIGDGSLLDFMDEDDIYALFGNILDNAIEATSELNESKRIIHLSFFEDEKDEIIITSENYFSGKYLQENAVLLTTKKDKKNHGYGLQSINYIARKYHGNFKYSIENEQFFLVVTLKKSVKS